MDELVAVTGFDVGDPGRAAAELGPRPPCRFPDSADHELSECRVPGASVRAASVRGLMHRYRHQPRQDRFSVVYDEPTGTLIVTVCDGVGQFALSQEAAAFVAADVPRAYLVHRDWRAAVDEVNERLQDFVARTASRPHLDEVPDDVRMATTLAAAAIHLEPGDRHASVAWTDDSSVWTLVLVGIMWGAVILIVDRALILSLKPRASKWLVLWMILPRIGMAALLGLVISTPLTLQIFNDEIEHQMTIDNIRKAEAEKAWAVWRCELDGQLCEAGSGRVGNGPRAQALKREYDRRQADANAAKALLDQKLAALEAARAASREQSGAKVAEAQAEANRVLPGLRAQRDALQAAIQTDLGTSNKEAAEDTGLLARLVALSHLGDENGWARLAHLLVAALLFMLELLPVAVKSAGRTGYIDKDLEKRKRRIAEDVHNEVEAVMRDLAIAQVKAWKQQVDQLTATGPWNGTTAGANGSGPSTATVPRRRSSVVSRIAAMLNLPPSRNHGT